MDNNYDFNSNMNFMLNKNLKTNVDNNIELQKTTLNSTSFNTTFKYIEDSLNFLYEKNRTLQDLIKYSKTFLTAEINTNISDCKALLQSIEKDKDLIKNKTYIRYSVPFYSSSTTILDRDNAVIYNANVYDGKLTLADKVINSYSASYFIVKRNKNCIYNNEYNYLASKNYRTLYMSEEISSSNIEETIEFKFNNTVKLNKLKLNLSNCKIKAVILNLENNKTKDLDIDNLNLFETQYVNSISITIASSNYSISQIKYSNKDVNNLNSLLDNINTDTNTIIDGKKYYYYLFGIDDIVVQYVTPYSTNGFYSQDINIDKLNSNEHLTLYTEESVQRGSIEYYIINGSESIPILPENQTQVIDEMIFHKLPTRFTVDTKYPVTIKYNNDIVNISLYEAINNKDSGYTVTYTPVINTIENIINNTIKIKAVIRSYDSNYVSFIKNIKLKKYGGSSWTL